MYRETEISCIMVIIFSELFGYWYFYLGFPGNSEGKESACKWYTQFDSWARKIPWRREWLPTPLFLPGKFYGQRSQVGYSPWGRKE